MVKRCRDVKATVIQRRSDVVCLLGIAMSKRKNGKYASETVHHESVPLLFHLCIHLNTSPTFL